MRFQVSRVMDRIEQRLTTDVTLAQAVVDLEEIARWVELDAGRPVNLVRIGMAVDALSRYLVDGGVMLYGVVGRALLSEPALTSKERMVLGRWADDGLIEVTSEIAGRAVEVADLTGLPLIALHPYPELGSRYPWLDDGGGRVWRLAARAGAAALSPMDDTAVPPAGGGAPAVGRAKVLNQEQPDGEAYAAAEATEPAITAITATAAEATEPATAATAAITARPRPVGVEGFTTRGVSRTARTRIARRRFVRAEPAGDGPATRQWRCGRSDCPVFGEHRRVGQPVPRRHQGMLVCPRHGEPVIDVGPRGVAYAVSIVVDDLPRQRFVVTAGQPLRVGRAVDDPEVVSVAEWLHEAAASWVSPVHLSLEVRDGGLVVTDLSSNGSVVWRRQGADDRGTAGPLRRASYPLGEWDSVEVYTGIELVRGDRRRAAVLGRDEPASVLVDAPTTALRQLSGPG